MLHLSTTDSLMEKIEHSIGIVRKVVFDHDFLSFDMFAFIQTLLGSELNDIITIVGRNIAEQRMIQKQLT